MESSSEPSIPSPFLFSLPVATNLIMGTNSYNHDLTDRIMLDLIDRSSQRSNVESSHKVSFDCCVFRVTFGYFCAESYWWDGRFYRLMLSYSSQLLSFSCWCTIGVVPRVKWRGTLLWFCWTLVWFSLIMVIFRFVLLTVVVSILIMFSGCLMILIRGFVCFFSTIVSAWDLHWVLLLRYSVGARFLLVFCSVLLLAINR